MPLSIALSYDGGTTWPYVRDLEYENHYPEQVRLPRGSSPPGTLGQVSSQSHEAAGLPAQPGDPDPDRTEYSYPTVLQAADGLLHVSHFYNRDTIK